MNANLYAITETSARAIEAGMPLFAGETVVDEVPPALVEKIRADDAREQRRLVLRATDWTQMADAPLTPAKKLEWTAYRQLLRDLPTIVGFPDVPWPQPPANTDGAADSVPGQSEPIPD